MTRILTLEGTSAARRSFIRANQQVMTEITIKNADGTPVKNADGTDSKAVEMISYVSHETTLPAAVLIPNLAYRRHGKTGAPVMLKKMSCGTVKILVNVVVVPVVQTVNTPDSVPVNA